MKLAEENKMSERSDGRGGGFGREKKGDCAERRRDKKEVRTKTRSRRRRQSRERRKKKLRGRGNRAEDEIARKMKSRGR